MKPTPQRILDAAEQLFADNGYQATSLGDVADEVGMRSPSLYNHFKNKEALYHAVVDRLVTQFSQPFDELLASEVSVENVLVWEETMMRQHIANPNLAKLLTHAALSGDQQGPDLLEKIFGPIFESANSQTDVTSSPTSAGFVAQLPELRTLLVMSYVNLIVSYVTLAPLYSRILGKDLMSSESADKQVLLLRELSQSLLLDAGQS